MRTEADLRQEMCEVGRLLWERGLVGATEGNLSVRIGNSILCTPSGLCKGFLKPEHLVVIDHNGSPIRGTTKPSSEIRLHLRALQVRPDIQAVVHAHPLTATAFAAAGETIPHDILPEAAYVLGLVGLAPFGMPGTEDLPDKAEPFFKMHRAVLLANHGAVTLGDSLTDAFYRMETLERVAQVVLKARQIGEPKRLPASALEQLLSAGEAAKE